MSASSDNLKLRKQNKALLAKNAELSQTLESIRNGEIDALMVAGLGGNRVFRLQSVEQPFREFVEAMNEGAVTISQEGIILYCNDRFVKMTQISHEKLLGSNILHCINVEFQNEFTNLLKRSLLSPSTSEVLLSIADQRALPVQISVGSIDIDDRKGFCLIATDQSAQKQTVELSAALRDRDQFMAALSHELRTPINVILGWVQLLRAHPEDKAMYNQALDTLERNAELQGDLIESLLDMSRIVTGSLILELRPVDLKTSVQDCLISLQVKAQAKEIGLEYDFSPECAVIAGDEKRIQQLISNLVQNAIKFTPPGGKINVRVNIDRSKKMANLMVTDSGQGIEPAFLPEVFHKFKQEDMSTSRTFGGLGLGLSICKKIVEQHHGKIAVESEGRGRGASFVVCLPLSVSKKSVQAPVLSKFSPMDLKGVRVILVDDSIDNLTLFGIWLKSSGADIRSLDSTLGVIDLLQSFKPHVLLSDISMPGEDGFSLIAKIRALSKELGGGIPTAALTANARNEDRADTLAAGFNLHIAKPVSVTALLQAVRSLADIGYNRH